MEKNRGQAQEAALMKKRTAELAERSCEQGRYAFTEFLALAEQSWLPPFAREYTTLWGGYEGAERKIARFGSELLCGYDEAFPILCIKVEPLSPKFAEGLSHRDFLGALMSLGVKRAVLGDVIVEEGAGWVFCIASMAEFITENLIEVRRTPVRCAISDSPPEQGAAPEECQLVVASERLDALVAAVCKLSRSASSQLFEEERVFVNGCEARSSSALPKPGDIVSIRGFGRFKYGGIERETKKGRLRVTLGLYK